MTPEDLTTFEESQTISLTIRTNKLQIWLPLFLKVEMFHFLFRFSKNGRTNNSLWAFRSCRIHVQKPAGCKHLTVHVGVFDLLPGTCLRVCLQEWPGLQIRRLDHNANRSEETWILLCNTWDKLQSLLDFWPACKTLTGSVRGSVFHRLATAGTNRPEALALEF